MGELGVQMSLLHLLTCVLVSVKAHLHKTTQKLPTTAVGTDNSNVNQMWLILSTAIGHRAKWNDMVLK